LFGVCKIPFQERYVERIRARRTEDKTGHSTQHTAHSAQHIPSARCKLCYVRRHL